ncbi:MAG: ABC transporter ATP-binding protein [Planctomycetota bacterium]|jgi:oligopeptide/dipeptide ABC transporter ATP-binding protein
MKRKRKMIKLDDMTNENNYLLEVDELKTYFAIRKGLMRRTVGYVKAVDGISFKIRRGQSLGLVGESGCGKTTAARTIARLIPAMSGQVTFDGVDVLAADKTTLRKLRRQMSIIFQDPYGSLNPRMTVGNIIGEPLQVQRSGAKDQVGQSIDVLEQVAELLGRVGLSPEYINRYPHEFSGGQRQRVGIARALVTQPRLIICDEPVSALDVSIQSQILNLLRDLQDEFGLTYLFIAHDLAVVEFFCDIIAVMYMGKIVEYGSAEQLYSDPLHPYTKALMSAIPEVETARRGRRTATGGEVPSLLNPPTGCPFNPRCPMAETRCREQQQKLEQIDDSGHFVACWNCAEKKARPQV